jgi:hypothetical protein
MSYPDGTWRQDDGFVINFPKEGKPLEILVVDDGDLSANLDCSMQSQNGAFAFDCGYSRVAFKIEVQQDLTGSVIITKPSGTLNYSLSCRDHR